MLFWRKKKNLRHYLTDTKLVSVKGFEFIIKKISVLNYVEGAKVMVQAYDTYTNAKAMGGASEAVNENTLKKAMDYYRDILCSAVVSPKITREPTIDINEIHVEVLFNDLELCQKLCDEILEFTYGKKNLKKRLSQGIALGT